MGARGRAGTELEAEAMVTRALVRLGGGQGLVPAGPERRARTAATSSVQRAAWLSAVAYG